jgi:hypothetical protein
MDQMPRMVGINVQIPESLHEKLRRMRSRTRLRLPEIVAEALAHYIAEGEREQAR